MIFLITIPIARLKHLQLGNDLGIIWLLGTLLPLGLLRLLLGLRLSVGCRRIGIILRPLWLALGLGFGRRLVTRSICSSTAASGLLRRLLLALILLFL